MATFGRKKKDPFKQLRREVKHWKAEQLEERRACLRERNAVLAVQHAQLHVELITATGQHAIQLAYMRGLEFSEQEAGILDDLRDREKEVRRNFDASQKKIDECSEEFDILDRELRGRK